MNESSDLQPPAAPAGTLTDDALRAYFDANLDRFTSEALYFQAVAAGYPAERARQVLVSAEAARQPGTANALRRTAQRAILVLFIVGFVAVATPVVLMWNTSYGLALPFLIGQLVLTLITYAFARAAIGATGAAVAPALVLMLISVALVAQLTGGFADIYLAGLIVLGVLGLGLVAFAWIRRNRPTERSAGDLLALLAVPLVFFLAFPGTCIYYLVSTMSLP